MTSRHKGMLHLWKKNLKKISKVKIISKLEIIAIIQLNMEEHIVFVI